MKTDIRLFIGGNEIEFAADPKILFNYKLTDISNPTVVKNSYSKSIEIEGTPKNNDVFENIWNLQRVQWGGIDFNPIKKTDFTIYVNGDIYERGYAKLDGITTKNRKITYSITLFGGLGSFFFNLSYKDSEGDDKKSLADLYYAGRDIGRVFYGAEPEMNFRINKESVWDAWNVITGNPDAVYDESEVNRPDNYYYDDKWEVLNFAPCYNGLPDDFDADKCIINKKDMPVLTFSKTDNGKTFTDYRGYAMGEQPNDELTEWETFDLRSYLQRPVVSMKRVIDACCNPVNNGGYEVDLDSTFFNYDNPYYRDAYLTLPMLRENIEGGETVISTDGEIVEIPLTGFNKEWSKLYDIDYNIDTISKIVNVDLGLNLELSTTGTANQLYLYRDFKAFPDNNSDIERVKSIESIGSICVQIAAFDVLGNCVASSNVYFVTDAKASGKAKFNEVNWKGSNGWAKPKYSGAGQGGGVNVTYQSTVPVPGVTNVYGSFKKNSSGKYELVDGNGNPIMLNFNFATETPYSKLEMSIQYRTYHDIEYYYPYKWWKGRAYNSVKTKTESGELKLYLNDGINYEGNIGIESAMNRNSYDASPILDIDKFELITKDYSEFFTNTYVRKQDILNTEKTPAEYLISYAKMFGLYFYYNPTEEAENSSLAPNGVIHLMTRDTYYTGEIVDLEDFINRDKGIKITPTTLDSKWINFNVEQVESEANKEHKDKFGYDYGYQKVNTGYNFNADNKAMLDKVVYKGGVEALETSKYYQLPTQGYPAYGENGFIYTLYNYSNNELNTLEVDDDFGTIFRNSINPNEWYDTDAFKKPQFHEKDNEGTDGKDVLLFFTGEKWYSDSFNYWITDDIEEMLALNDGKPCWVMTAEMDDVNGNRIAYPINTLPIFQRNIVYGNGIIKHSWDFGNPFITFVRDMYAGEQSGLYYKCWKDYIGDLYSEDNRILNTYVVFKEAPNTGALRKFYWFDGCLWRMNAIKDWNVAGYESTAVEFIKVIDEENYKLTPITNTIVASFTFPNLQNVDDEFGGNEYEHYYRISADAQEVTGVINVGNAGSWSFGDGAGADAQVVWTDGTYETYLYSDIMEPSNDYGTGDAIKVFSLTANTKTIERTWNFNILDNDDRSYIVHIIQSGVVPSGDTPNFTLSPSSYAFDANGGKTTIYLTDNNTNSFRVTSYPNWISILNVQDNSFEIQTGNNTTGANRTGTIGVTCSTQGYSDITKYVQITQRVLSGSVGFDKTVVYVGKNVNDTSEQVNITWNNITERSFGVKPNDRFRFNLIDGTNAFSITALKANNQSTPITGSFTITCKDTNGNAITKSITIVQTP